MLLERLRSLPAAAASAFLAQALNVSLRPRLNAAHRGLLLGRAVSIEVLELGLACAIVWDGRSFVAARSQPELFLRARVPAYAALLTRREDPDTLFFQRRLIIEGDTAFGLGIKNLLDAIETPAWLSRAERFITTLNSRFF